MKKNVENNERPAWIQDFLVDKESCRQISWQVREIKRGYILWLQVWLQNDSSKWLVYFNFIFYNYIMKLSLTLNFDILER